MRLYGNFRFSFLRCCFAGLIHSQLSHQVSFFFFSGDILKFATGTQPNRHTFNFLRRFTSWPLNSACDKHPPRLLSRTIYGVNLQIRQNLIFNEVWFLEKKRLLFFQFWSAFKLIEISSFNNQFSSAAKMLKGSNPNPKQSSKCTCNWIICLITLITSNSLDKKSISQKYTS